MSHNLGPKPNLKTKLTKKRAKTNQSKNFLAEFYDRVYFNPEKDFFDIYNECKKNWA